MISNIVLFLCYGFGNNLCSLGRNVHQCTFNFQKLSVEKSDWVQSRKKGCVQSVAAHSDVTKSSRVKGSKKFQLSGKEMNRFMS